MHPSDPKYALRQAAAAGGRCPLSGKKRFSNPEAAKAGVRRRAKRGRPLYVYACPDPACRGYHITKQPQGTDRNV